MPLQTRSLRTYVDVLRARAAEHGDRLVYRFLVNGEGREATLSYARLEQQARRVAASLQQRGAKPGDRVLLLYPPCLDYAAGFFGCLFGGFVAVPAYPPDPARIERTLPRLRAISSDSGCRYALTTTPVLGLAKHLFGQAPDLARLEWLASDAVEPALADAWKPPTLDGSSTAFLQYTSGSTGHPKGVILAHDHLIANQRQIRAAMRHTPGETTVVSWLPVYHDMGLIGALLQPIWLQTSCTLMSPIHFIQRPIRWLRAITRYGATSSGGPNFGYELCTRKVKPAQLEELDLSSWRVA